MRPGFALIVGQNLTNSQGKFWYFSGNTVPSGRSRDEVTCHAMAQSPETADQQTI